MHAVYSAYNSGVPITAIDSFDWSSSDHLDPFQIVISHQSIELANFLKSFTKAKTFGSATPDQYAHLIHVLQCTILSFGKYVDKLKSRLHKIEKENIEYKNKATAKESFLCPICLDPLKSLTYLDKHMQERHPNATDKWNSLRCEDLPGISIKQFKIESMQKNNDNLGNVQKNQNNEVVELHNWMNAKFDYLEGLILSKEKRRQEKNKFQHKKVTGRQVIPIPIASNNPPSIQSFANQKKQQEKSYDERSLFNNTKKIDLIYNNDNTINESDNLKLKREESDIDDPTAKKRKNRNHSLMKRVRPKSQELPLEREESSSP